MRPANYGSFFVAVCMFALAGTVLGASAAGCGPAYCTFRGTLNDPANRTMRRTLLKKGMGDFCQQMLERNAPLRLAPDSPVIKTPFPDFATQVACSRTISMPNYTRNCHCVDGMTTKRTRYQFIILFINEIS